MMDERCTYARGQPAASMLLGTLWLLPWIQPFSFGPYAAGFSMLLAWVGASLLLWYGARHTQVFAWTSLTAAALNAYAGGLQYFGWGTVFAPWVSLSQLGLAYGNLYQRNQFASLMGVGLVCLLYLLHGLRNTSSLFGGHLRFVWMMCLGTLIAMGAAMSTSRTGFAQWLAVWLVFEMGIRVRKRYSAPVLVWASRWCLVCYFATLWAAPQLLPQAVPRMGASLLERLQAPVDCNSRLVLWSNVWELVLQKPWWGWGWGELDYAHFSTMFTSERFCSLVDNAHNLPLHLAVELGGVVALGVLATLGYWVWRERPWRERDPERLLAWGILGLIAIHSLLEFPLWYGPFQLTVFWCVWVLLRRKECAAHPPMVATLGLGGRCRQAQILLAGLLLGLASVLAWDYARVSQVYRPVAERWALLGLPQRSVFFQDYLDFARFTTTELSAENAAEMVVLGQRMLHFSPEARVVVKLLEAAQGSGRDDLHQWLLPRFEAAYPAEYAAWRARQAP